MKKLLIVFGLMITVYIAIHLIAIIMVDNIADKEDQTITLSTIP